MDPNALNPRQKTTVQIPCRLDYLRVARKAVAEFCARADTPPGWCDQFEMAVDEACANIIEHSRRAGADDGLRINLTEQDGCIEAEIRDSGQPFNYEQVEPISPGQYIEEGRCRGLGLHIIRSFVDSVSYNADARNGNRLLLVKRLPQARSSAPGP